MPSSSNEQWKLIGFIGLGAMGGGMARRLLSAGYSILGFDINDEALGSAVAAGAAPAKSCREVAKRCQLVLISLPSSEVFVEVAENDLLPAAREMQIFVDLGTTAAPRTRRFAAEFARKGSTLLDAPVSGWTAGAAEGTLRVFVGGEESIYRRCRPILEVLGDPDRIVYCGPSGAGQVVKGVNQLAMGLSAAACLEAMAMGVRAGVNPAVILQGVGGTEDWRSHFGGIARKIIDGEGNRVVVKFPELPYFMHEAEEQGFDLPLTKALFKFCNAGDRVVSDNMNRPVPSFWNELMNQGASQREDADKYSPQSPSDI